GGPPPARRTPAFPRRGSGEEAEFPARLCSRLRPEGKASEAMRARRAKTNCISFNSTPFPSGRCVRLSQGPGGVIKFFAKQCLHRTVCQSLVGEHHKHPFGLTGVPRAGKPGKKSPHGGKCAHAPGGFAGNQPYRYP